MDEADEMLDRGFMDSIKDIFSYMPKNVQVGLFSATLKEDTLSITNKFMRNPKTILVTDDELTLEGIRQ